MELLSAKVKNLSFAALECIFICLQISSNFDYGFDGFL